MSSTKTERKSGRKLFTPGKVDCKPCAPKKKPSCPKYKTVCANPAPCPSHSDCEYHQGVPILRDTLVWFTGGAIGNEYMMTEAPCPKPCVKKMKCGKCVKVCECKSRKSRTSSAPRKSRASR